MRNKENSSKRFNNKQSSFRERQNEKKSSNDGLTRLNKHIANAGICSRREADQFIEAVVVSVNGKVVTSMGFKVSKEDVVKFNNSTIRREKEQYVLLNKPKNYITNTKDPGKQNSVIRLVERICKEQILPIGKLDRISTGLMLFTNDSDLLKKLSSKNKRIKTIYQVSLNKSLLSKDLKNIQDRINKEKSQSNITSVNYVEGKDKNEVGIEVTLIKSQIIYQTFEDLGYKVMKIDRVYFAGLTKKNLPRKECRFLTKEEITILRRI